MEPASQAPAPVSATPSLLSSIPRLTRFLAIALCFFTLLAYPKVVGAPFVNTFALLPMATLGASKIWNLVTAGFLELSPVKSVVNVLLILTMGKWIESSWGSGPFFLYLVLVNFCAGLATYVVLMAAFFLTRLDHFLFAPVGTTNGICAALLVAVKQLIPEHEIGVNGVNISANYLPVSYIAITLVLTLTGFVSVGDLTFTLAAFQAAWLYLRYFQRRNGQRGDLSDEFLYSSMFPEPLRTVVALFAYCGYILFKPVLMAGINAQPELEAAQQLPVSKASSLEAERRRQRALEALDKHMSANADDADAADNQV